MRFRKRWAHHNVIQRIQTQNDGEKDARTGRTEQDCGNANGDEPGRHCLDKFFIFEQSDYVEKPGDTQSLKSTEWMFRET